jgi:hypothetical protein
LEVATLASRPLHPGPAFEAESFASKATDFFRLPADQVFEIGIVVEL